MDVIFDRWPCGARRCVTFSYDDGQIEDRRLAELFRSLGLKATFHLNSAFFDDGKHVQPEEFKEVYSSHELAAHTHTHPFLSQMPLAEVTGEIMENRMRLEEAWGEPVRGMSWPYGQYDPQTEAAAVACGIEYSRTTRERTDFLLPERPLEWHPTCHHNKGLEMWQAFMSRDYAKKMQLFYVWGHSFEFTRDNNWEMMEQLCRAVAGRPEVWYATNIQIIDYLNCLKHLRATADGRVWQNPGPLDIWASVGGEPICIKAGQTLRL